MPSEAPPRWTDRLVSDRALAIQAALAALVAAAIFGYLVNLRPPQSHLWGDEGTYVAMTASLARDLDLSFSEADHDWALQRGTAKGVAVILQRTPAGITYSKPLLYPLLAALPYRIIGESGMVLVNLVAVAVGFLFAWLYLRRIGAGGHLWLTLVSFAGYSAVAPYVLWRMSEAVQVGLAMTGLALACGGLRCASERCDRLDSLLDHRAAPYVGGALLGLLTSMRTSNALLIAGAFMACLLVAGRKRSLAVAIGAAAALVAILGLSLLGLGSASPYTAERSSFNADIGYPAGPDANETLARFDTSPATHRVHFELTRVSLYSAYYFLVGRHTGLLAYFPLALVLLYLLARQASRLGLVMLATTLALATFYLVYMPNNYFGGSTFIGNRYFLITYPALLIGLKKLPSPRLLAVALTLGLLFGVSAVKSVRLTRELDPTSQSHTAAGAFLSLPYESTAIQIQGQRSRFWSRDYVRFTNSYATVQRNRFMLHSDRPYAELMIASRIPRRELFFLIRPVGGLRTLDWQDWTRDGRALLEPNDRTGGEIVSLSPGSPWRYHPFWWPSDDLYDVRVVRLKLRATEDRPRQAEVYYLGDDATILDSYGHAVTDRQLPSQGIAGERGRVELRVRNTSGVAWSPEGVLPVMIGYRIDGHAGTVSSAKQPIPDIVRPGETSLLDLDVVWPEEPGEYRLVVDLVLHPVYWFAERTQEPVATQTVEILPARAADN